jgi:hypothetical protein
LLDTHTSLIHTIDPSWREDKGVTFTFVPENEADGRMYVSSLIPYLRAVHPWFLSMFSEEAKNRHRRNHWDSTTNQLFSTDESGMDENIYIDNELNCSEEPTATKPEKIPAFNNPDIQVDIPDVEITSDIPPVLKDTDSVSTFRSRTRNTQSRTLIRPHSPNDNMTHTPTSNSPTRNVNDITDTDDGSVSKLSDTVSRLSAFESRFNTVTDELSEALGNVKLQTERQENEFKEQRLLLISILNALQTTSDQNSLRHLQPLGEFTFTTSDKANHLTQLNQTGDPGSGAAGTDS